MADIKTISRFREDHKGMTMAEILVVLCILSIVVGISGLSIALMSSRDQEKCAKTIEQLLEEARRSGMAMKGTFILNVDTADHRAWIDSSEQGVMGAERLPGQVEVTLKAEGGTADISADTILRVEFDKGTGRVRSVSTGGKPAVDGTLVFIHCSGGGKTATVVLVRATGKHYITYGS